SFLKLYFDFSGYSDLSIGAARLFGIQLMENFNWPVLAPNIGQFWRRWHMSLGAWCQAYIYMPVLGRWRNPYVSAYATMLVMGLWHAGSWSYVFWGLYHATGLSLFLTWTRFKARRGWKLGAGKLSQLTGAGLTVLFVSVGMTFTLSLNHGGLPTAFRVLSRLVFLDGLFR
ncbi:MAG: hypothetical protein JNL58_29935, partial [Planctomyces sp.]|nr:hypothetical protein [Planctomyces sp.]